MPQEMAQGGHRGRKLTTQAKTRAIAKAGDPAPSARAMARAKAVTVAE